MTYSVTSARTGLPGRGFVEHPTKRDLRTSNADLIVAGQRRASAVDFRRPGR